MYYYYEACKLTILAQNIPNAANTLRQMLQNRKNYYSKDIDINVDDVALIKAVALADGWYCGFNRDGDLVDTVMRDQQRKSSDGTDWIQTLAPHIEDGGYIQIRDDNNYSYRICFYDGKPYVAYPSWPTKDEILAKAAPME